MIRDLCKSVGVPLIGLKQSSSVSDNCEFEKVDFFLRDHEFSQNLLVGKMLWLRFDDSRASPSAFFAMPGVHQIKSQR